MPRNFRRFFASVFLVLFSIFIVSAQSTADVMRERITKAKAYIAVKNYNAAIYELENIRRETNEPTINSVVNVLLMSSYLEQSDYKRAQDFLKELAKSNKNGYTAVAGQVVKGARSQLERYKSLGLSVSDRNLPLEAAADVEKMRQTLELVIEQSKVLGKEKTQSSNAIALLEEASNARSGLAKDDYDATRWKNEAADAREMMANSKSVVLNADGSTETVIQNSVASNNTPTTTQANQVITPTNLPTQNNNSTTIQTSSVNNNSTNTTQTTVQNTAVAVKEETPKKVETETAKTDETAQTTNKTRTRLVENNNPTNTNESTTDTNNNILPLTIGSLVDYATQRFNPVYPQQARTIRQTGIVKVEVVIDEEGKVSEVQKASGPSLLQSAAKDAAKKWRFKPFLRDGQPVKAAGFISFNFTL